MLLIISQHRGIYRTLQRCSESHITWFCNAIRDPQSSGKVDSILFHITPLIIFVIVWKKRMSTLIQ